LLAALVLMLYFYEAYKNKIFVMKKLFMLATAAIMFSGVAFADGGKTKKKKCAKGKSCCTKTAKSCCKDKAEKTAQL
jgi:hypothetical protein